MSARPTAVVTGASGGIGAACARRLATDGYDVWVTARRAERVQQVAEEVDGRALVVDVTDVPAEPGDAVEVIGRRRRSVEHAGWGIIAPAAHPCRAPGAGRAAFA